MLASSAKCELRKKTTKSFFFELRASYCTFCKMCSKRKEKNVFVFALRSSWLLCLLVASRNRAAAKRFFFASRLVSAHSAESESSKERPVEKSRSLCLALASWSNKNAQKTASSLSYYRLFVNSEMKKKCDNEEKNNSALHAFKYKRMFCKRACWTW